MSTTRRTARRLAVRVAGFVGALVVGLAAAASAAPSAWWAPLTATGCAAASGASHAGLVVDFGTVAGSPGNVESSCVPFSQSRETGTQLLLDAGHTLGWNTRNGLLCSIDGYPAGGCTMTTYWSYWHGGSKWTYANDGPDGHAVAPGGVDGWRFVSGSDSASDRAPRPAAAGPCSAAAPTTTTTRAATQGSSPTTVGSGGSDHATATSTVAPGDSATAVTDKASHSATTTSTGSSPLATGDGSAATGAKQPLASPPDPHRSGSGSSSPLGAIAVAALVVALAIGAFVVARVRSSP